jgi:hypothetical protein
LPPLFERSEGKQPPVVLILVVLGAASTLGGLIWIIVAAANLYDDAANTSERAASLPAIAAGVSLTATVLLVAVTAWYAVLTRRGFVQWPRGDRTAALGGDGSAATTQLVIEASGCGPPIRPDVARA